jgi:catechol 2,3-dioxygenase-like lactoylglutathione lyase family enzyme
VLLPGEVDELGVGADGDEGGAELLEAFLLLCQSSEFGGSDEGEVGGVEEQDGPLSLGFDLVQGDAPEIVLDGVEYRKLEVRNVAPELQGLCFGGGHEERLLSRALFAFAGGFATRYHPRVRIHHLALRVRNLEAAREFYCGVLGLSEVKQDSSRSIWLRAGDAVLMLERSLRGKGEEAGSGHVLAFAAGDLACWQEKLLAAGIPIDDRTDSTIFVRDPDGHRVALSVYPF